MICGISILYYIKEKDSFAFLSFPNFNLKLSNLYGNSVDIDSSSVPVASVENKQTLQQCPN